MLLSLRIQPENEFYSGDKDQDEAFEPISAQTKEGKAADANNNDQEGDPSKSGESKKSGGGGSKKKKKNKNSGGSKKKKKKSGRGSKNRS